MANALCEAQINLYFIIIVNVIIVFVAVILILKMFCIFSHFIRTYGSCVSFCVNCLNIFHLILFFFYSM